MGFIRAGINAFKNNIGDAMALEFYALPNEIDETVVAVLGEQVKQNPNGEVTRSRKDTGKISNGSKVIVPQGWVALMVNNGKFLLDLAEPGEHIWDDGSKDSFFSRDAKFTEKISGIWKNIKENFAFGGQETANQAIVYIKTQPLSNNLFGTSSPVEYFSERYQQHLNVTFRGFFDLRVSDPVLFFAQNVSTNWDNREYRVEQIANGSLRKTITPKLGVVITKFVAENKCEIPQLTANMDEFSLMASQNISQLWEPLYGVTIIQIQLEDIGWDTESKSIIDKIDDQLRYKTLGLGVVERERAQNEALKHLAQNEGANGMMFGMGMMGGFQQMGAGMFAPNQSMPQQTAGSQVVTQQPANPPIITQPTGYVNAEGQFVQTGTVQGYFDHNGNFVKI